MLFALLWLTFGFGLIDLAGVVAPDVESDDPAGDIGVLGITYGAVATFLIPGAFLAQMAARYQSPGAMQQVLVLAAAFALAGTVGLDPLSFISVGILLGMLGTVYGLHPRPRPGLLRRLDPPRGLSRPIVVVVAIGAPGWLVYAWHMSANSRARIDPDELASRPAAGGWAGAAVLAIAVLLLGLLAAAQTGQGSQHGVRGPSGRLPAWTVLLAVLPVAWVSVIMPSVPGSFGRAGGIAAAAWAVALVAATEVSTRRAASTARAALTASSARHRS